VFHTANIVRVVSVDAVVVISFVAAPPRVRLQPPKLYPDRLVVAVLDNESVESLSESPDRVEDSLGGTDVAKVLPSKTMVGLEAIEALADEGIAVSPAIARRPVKTMAVVLFVSDMALELRTVDMAFPSMVRFVLLKLTLSLWQ